MLCMHLCHTAQRWLCDPNRPNVHTSCTQVEFLTKELGFDAAYNYKTAKTQLDALEKLCPEGIDM